MAIDVIFGADALTPPLTGIGRYSYELARQLRGHSEIERLRYFSMGRWVPDPLDGLTRLQQTNGAQDTPGAVAKPPMLSRVRTALAANPTAVRLYQAVMPKLASWQLRGQAQAVFHSPNYLVPQFPGPAVNTVHDLSHLFYPEFHPQARVDFMNLAFDESLRNTTHVITDTETVRQEFMAHFGWSADQVTAIGLGVDAAFHPRSGPELAQALAPLGLEPGQYALYVGTLEPRKNVARLLQAYAQLDAGLRRAYPLVVVGGKGWKSDEIHRLMEQAAAQGWLRYLSYVDQRDLPVLYAGARLFAYPSLYEGFGLPIVEAMASAVPVLTSAASCMPEVAGGAAKLVNPLDVEDMCGALAQCLEDASWQAMARQQGLERVASYSWARCANETVAVYQQVMR